MNFTSPPGIALSSSLLKTTTFLNQRYSRVELWDFSQTVKGKFARLRALYAKSFRITLAPPVLPRLLAQSWPGLFVEVMS